MLRELLKNAPTSAGYEAILAKDGDEGLRLFIQAPADLVIVDLYMAGRDGMEIISDLRRRAPRLPLIAMSGRYLADELLRVTKPTAAGLRPRFASAAARFVFDNGNGSTSTSIIFIRVSQPAGLAQFGKPSI